MKRLVYLCDWLPPDFGAVGQYAVLFAQDWAKRGWEVTLVGLTSGRTRSETVDVSAGSSMKVIRVHREKYDKQKLFSRLIWTLGANFKLLLAARRQIWTADAVLFTGSPPLMLHFIAPLNIFLRKKLIYRITDFHPECSIAERGGKPSLFLKVLLALTKFWRRRVSYFEVLGIDQAQRLQDMGIPNDRIELKRDPSPVDFPAGLQPLVIPENLQNGAGVILYSGNWGVAHDDATFVEAYAEYFKSSQRPLRFWLNAIGAKADRVSEELKARSIPFYRSALVPLEDVPRLLISVDVHLVTLRDAFVGYVLPSKIHACLDSHKCILFIGSERSDVHVLASQHGSTAGYYRVETGDVTGAVEALREIESRLLDSKKAEIQRGPAASRSIAGSTAIVKSASH